METAKQQTNATGIAGAFHCNSVVRFILGVGALTLIIMNLPSTSTISRIIQGNIIIAEPINNDLEVRLQEEIKQTGAERKRLRVALAEVTAVSVAQASTLEQLERNYSLLSTARVEGQSSTAAIPSAPLISSTPSRNVAPSPTSKLLLLKPQKVPHRPPPKGDGGQGWCISTAYS